MSGVVLCLIAGIAAGADDAPDAGITDITWTLGPNLPEFRKGGCAAALDGKVVSVFGMRYPWGEMDTMYVYDPATQWWTRGPDGPVGQCYVQGTECGGAFYAIGGRKGQVRQQCYVLKTTPAGYEWRDAPSLNDARGWPPSVAVGSRLFAFGGAESGHGPTLSSAEMLDTARPERGWQRVAPIPGESRGWLGAAAAGGRAYIFGGAHFFTPKPADGPDRKRLDETLCYDPASEEWQTRAPMPYRLSGMDACVYGDRYIIVVGGAAETGDFTPKMSSKCENTERNESYYCPFVLVYDTKTDRWTVLPGLLPMPTNDIRVVLIGDKLYALGGENVESATSNTTAWLRIGTIHR